MIVVKIQGGIGNQMFQYAFAKALSLQKNTEFKLHIPDNSIKTYSNIKKIIIQLLTFLPLKTRKIREIIYFKNFPRNFQLKEFGIKNEQILNDKEFYQLQLSIKFEIVSEIQFNYDPTIFEVSENVYLNGFWQSEKYFANIRKILKEELKLIHIPQSPYFERILNTNSVAIHIRRGDYRLVVENEPFGILNIDYYKKAIIYIKTKVNNPFFYIFSDDELWVKSVFLNKLNEKQMILIKSQTEEKTHIDLWLISNCKHCIVANSSFSWWGAWLNSNPDKIVICPKIPFKDKALKSTVDYYPNDWVRIDND